MKIQVFDPPMCCSTGICGPGVDPALVAFSADLEWLKRQGLEVERFNLSQQPQSFVSNPVVTGALKEQGNECLPLILIDGKIVLRGVYPSREKLAELVGLRPSKVELAVTVERVASANEGCCSTPGLSTDSACCDSVPAKSCEEKLTDEKSTKEKATGKSSCC